MSNQDEPPNFSFALMRTRKVQENTCASVNEKYEYFAVDIKRWHRQDPAKGVAAVMDTMSNHGVAAFHVAGPATDGEAATRLLGTFIINLDAFSHLGPPPSDE